MGLARYAWQCLRISPRLIGDYGSAYTRPFELPASDRFSYQWNADQGWLVSDVSDPENQEYLGTYAELTSITSMYAEVISGNYALWYDEFPAQLIDISNPGKPRAIARVPLRKADGFVSGNLFITGGLDGVSLVELPPFIKPIARREGMLDLSWESWGQAQLQRTTSLTNPDWQDLIGSENVREITVPQWSGCEFFRLVKP